ncbi:hypothetical protein D3C87_1838420 [compost metagenome]
MKKIVLVLAIVTSSTLAHAMMAGGAAVASFAAFSMTVGTVASKSAHHNKIILNAQEDAYAFIASEGQIRGVQLQKALETVRSENPAVAASDMELAQAILSL